MDDATLQQQIISLEKEILALKQSQSYVSVATAGIYRSTNNMAVGTYTITYEEGEYPVISYIYAIGNSDFQISNITTPKDNKQTFYIEAERPVLIVASRKIISVQ